MLRNEASREFSGPPYEPVSLGGSRWTCPGDTGAAVGKTAWWISLGTADRLAAEAAVGGQNECHKRLIAELDKRLEAGKARLVAGFVDQALAASTEQHGCKDRAVVHDLVFLTRHVAGSCRMKRVLAGVGRLLDDEQLIARGLTLRVSTRRSSTRPSSCAPARSRAGVSPTAS